MMRYIRHIVAVVRALPEYMTQMNSDSELEVRQPDQVYALDVCLNFRRISLSAERIISV
jgi:hypothetical protein